jgi:hypothetical protein
LDAFPGTLREAAAQIVYQDGHTGQLVKRAAEYARRRKWCEPLVIQGKRPDVVDHIDRRSVGGLELRSAAAVDVHRARRELDLLIAPAEVPATIYERGRSFVETFAHGAFDGTNPENVKCNLHHVRERVIGRCIALDPWAESGLTGTVRLARVKDADEALALIDDDLLGVSAGFAVTPGGDEWRGDRRKIKSAVLDHVALVVEAAHAAKITAVRGRELLAGYRT